MSGHDAVALSVHDGLARLRLRRAGTRNAMDAAVAAALSDAAAACAARTDLRALLIEAEGETFSIGADVRELRAAGDALGAELQRMIADYHAALVALDGLAVPVVTAVQGAVAGGALGLLWCADVVLLADDARLASGFARLGLAGDGGSSWAVPRLAGPRRAWRFLVDGEVLSAGRALDWGLVSAVVPAAALADEALAVARRLAAGPTLAIARLRRLMSAAPATSWAEHLDAERLAMAQLVGSADAREGIAAFAQRRDPGFSGR